MAEGASSSGGFTAEILTPAFGTPQTGQRDIGRGGGSGGGGGGGGGSVGMDVKAYIDAQDEKTRAQNDARFVRIESKIGTIKIPSIWQIAGVVFAGVGICFGILGFASDRFDGGLAARSVMDPIIEAQKMRDTGQDKKLDKILTVVEQIRDKPQGSPQKGQN